MKNGRIYGYQDYVNMDFTNCPNLAYVCVDEVNITGLQNKLISEYSYNQCNVNSYCSFVPGGAYYITSGTSRYDATGNGCDANDTIFNGLYFSVSGITGTSMFTGGNSGNYSVPLQAGSYTFTPVFQNPEYFVATPSSLPVTFTTNSQPVIQDFCISATGQHQDIEVSVLPITPARPGFDSYYKIIYRNKGTVTLSGSLSFTFEEPKLDFVSATPSPLSQSGGTLAWDYSNLSPLETREIMVVLNINSPMETPAVNNGDQLNFNATINPVAGDEIPADNVFGFKQTVVGSFDPNDKTCIEGDIVSPEIIGNYVHYVIRFENTGTFAAENIVVKDMIDAAKFDVSTLVPLSSSHPFVTRITNTNKAEFIFENINLPFDDASNDGYVAFKIKTKPTLVIGDTFSNNASIYFDYNFPIVTNTAATIIQLLGNPDFDFSDAFVLYPNPVKNTLNIQSRNGMELNSASIYNIFGQLILTETGTIATIDVSSLQSGQYFLKVHSDSGNAVTKFIRQ